MTGTQAASVPEHSSPRADAGPQAAVPDGAFPAGARPVQERPGGERPEGEDVHRVRGLAVYRREAAGAPRVVLVHGGMDRGASFIKVARKLPELDVVRYDRRGYGRSIDAPLREDLAEQVADLDAVIGDEPCAVIGHSLGGVIALMLACRRPERVTAIGAFEAPMPWAAWWPEASAGGRAVRVSEQEGTEVAAERFMRRIIGDEMWERLPRATQATRRAEGAALITDLKGMRTGVAPYELADVTVPVVAGRGDQSDPQHQRAAHALAEGVTGAELVVIEGAGHGAHYAQPTAFADFVRRVVERSSPPE